MVNRSGETPKRLGVSSISELSKSDHKAKKGQNKSALFRGRSDVAVKRSFFTYEAKFSSRLGHEHEWTAPFRAGLS
jgi:hypothetical protein